MASEIVWEMLISVGDKLLPEVIKRFIPLVTVRPRELKFHKSEWTSESHFVVYNRSKQVLSDIYLMIEINGAETEDFDLSKIDSSKDLKITIKDIEINYEIVRLNLIREKDTDVILLKIARIDPSSFISFRIVTNTDSVIKLKIIQYSKTEPTILYQAQAGAVSFQIPTGLKGKASLKSVAVLMKRNN